MKPRLTIIFLLIVLVPLVTATWLGVRVSRNERAGVRERFKAVLDSRLNDITTDIEQVISRYETDLLVSTKLSRSSVEKLRALSRDSAIARQYFLFDKKDGLVYPTMSDETSQNEALFLARTKALWEDGAISFETYDLTPPPPPPSAQSQSTKTLSKGFSKGKGSTVPEKAVKYVPPPVVLTPTKPKTGWHVWFDGPGLNLLFWWENENGLIAGAEVNRSRLMADIIGALPDTVASDTPATGRIELVDSAGRTLYLWGVYEPKKNEQPLVTRALDEPLNAWHLRYFAPDPAGVGNSAWFNIGIGLLVLALAVGGLAYYFFREHTREMREAGQRVSFVNQVSHELKTPLTSIRMYAELLAERFDGEDENTRRHLGIIESESRRLSRLIGNVLTFGRQERSALTLRATEGVLDELVRDVLRTFDDALTAQGLQVTFQADAPEPALMDREVIEQILGNLLSNVEKYAASGDHVDILTQQEGDVLTLIVADNGPGIPPRERDRIFGAFYRVGDALSDGVTGTGIGLAIARDLARLHGGDIRLEPSEQGARFAVTLRASRITEAT